MMPGDEPVWQGQEVQTYMTMFLKTTYKPQKTVPNSAQTELSQEFERPGLNCCAMRYIMPKTGQPVLMSSDHGGSLGRLEQNMPVPGWPARCEELNFLKSQPRDPEPAPIHLYRISTPIVPAKPENENGRIHVSASALHVDEGGHARCCRH